MIDDLRREDGTPFFTNITQIAAEVQVGLLFDSPALLIGDKFVRLTAPEAKQLADKVRELAA